MSPLGIPTRGVTIPMIMIMMMIVMIITMMMMMMMMMMIPLFVNGDLGVPNTNGVSATII